MKSILLLSFVFFLTTVYGQKMLLEKSNFVEYRIAFENVKFENTGIQVDQGAHHYLMRFSEAIEKPGDLILVMEEKKAFKLKLVFRKLVEVERGFIVYDDLEKRISYLKFKKTTEESSYLLLFGFASLILMIISNVLFKKGYKSIVFAMYAVAAAITSFVAVAIMICSTHLISSTILFTAPAAVAFMAAVAAAADKNVKSYKLWSIIFYILLIISFTFLFI
jgi:hypothetical protein